MPDKEEEDGLLRVLEVAARLLSLAYAAWLIWTLIPEHRRRLMIMRGMAGIRNGAARAASRTGAQAISLEARTGAENYLVPYALSRVREAASAAYEKLRYS